MKTEKFPTLQRDSPQDCSGWTVHRLPRYRCGLPPPPATPSPLAELEPQPRPRIQRPFSDHLLPFIASHSNGSALNNPQTTLV